MFCTHCGNQLPDGTRFCVFCGTAQESAPAPVEEAPAAPVSEAVQPPVAESLAEDSFINAVAVEEATYETPFIATPEFTPPVRTPAPKKKKTGLIIAIILVLVLLAGAAVGMYFWLDYKNTTAYEDATAMLEAGDINGALTAFEDLGDYEDSAKMVKNLKKYQQALKKLDAHEYDEAREIFENLGKFHDSKTYVQSGVDYHKANYLMACAEKSDESALALIPNGDSIAANEDFRGISIELYYAAAELFTSLGDYQASADLASECWLAGGVLELDRGHNEAAIDLLDKLNSDDAAALQTAIENHSADASLLQDLEFALRIWLDEDDASTIEEESQKALEHLKIYEDLFFLDPRLEELYGAFMDALEVQLDAIDSGDDVEDWVEMYQGMADLYKVCETLHKEYDFLKGSQLEDQFIGVYETVAKYPTIEKSLEEQLSSVSAPWDDEKGYYYAPYTNDTPYDFVLTVSVDFYRGDEYLETGKDVEINVPAGESIQIPLIPLTLKDGEFDGWVATWWFDIP